MTWTWDFMIEVFRSLGGTADNIVQRIGPLGRGIFAIDPSRPVRIRVPENLLVPVDDIEFAGDKMGIKGGSQLRGPERIFFENYQNTFSWGAQGYSDSVAFLKDLDGLPASVRELLSTEFGMQALLDGGSERVAQWFLNSRLIRRNGKLFVMPLIELVNHAPNARGYDLTDGVSIEGLFPGEVLVLYDITDPFGIFRRFGFASPETIAFSSPMNDKSGKARIVIDKKINFDSRLGSFPIPDFKVEGDTLMFSCLMIGNAKFPRLCKGIFYRIMRDAGHPDAEEAFDVILYQNRSKFFRLLAALEPYEGGLIPVLRTTARFQLEAMSHNVGSREL